jgi:hypothetical protein
MSGEAAEAFTGGKEDRIAPTPVVNLANGSAAAAQAAVAAHQAYVEVRSPYWK